MTYLAAIKMGEGPNEELHIIMDLANSTLHYFLRSTPSVITPVFDPAKVTMWTMLSEAAELAGALAWLHDGIQVPGKILGCCHMDLKPDNILVVFETGFPVGRWKIADFGISAIRTPKERHGEGNHLRAPRDRLETIMTKPKRLAGPYVAPEICDGSNEVGRTSDIWSLACILVDVIASQMTEDASIQVLAKRRERKENGQDYHEEDHFYRDKALNPHIEAWVNALNTTSKLKDQAQRYALADCQALLREMLNIVPDRPSAKKVREELIKAYELIPESRNPSASALTDSEGGDEVPSPIDLSALASHIQPMQATSFFPSGREAQADYLLLDKTQKWIHNPQLEVLWIDEPQGDGNRSVSPICSGLYDAAQSENIPVIFHWCSRKFTKAGLRVTKLDMLIELTYSLLCQLQNCLNSCIPTRTPVNQQRFDTLDRSPATIATAISVLKDLWAAMPMRWFCIIDGFNVLEDVTDPDLRTYIEALLDVLCPKNNEGGAGKQHNTKTLITTGGRSLFLGRRQLPFQSKVNATSSSGSVRPVSVSLNSAIRESG